MKNKKKNEQVLRIVAQIYNRLYYKCKESVTGYTREEFEDIFQDCILFIYTDPLANGLTNKKEIEGLFLYRFRMIEFTYAKKKQKLREIAYADHIQTTQKTDENG